MNTHVRARLLTSGRDCACVAERIRGGGREQEERAATCCQQDGPESTVMTRN